MSLGILQRKQREKIMERQKGSIKLDKAEPNKQTSIKMMIGQSLLSLGPPCHACSSGYGNRRRERESVIYIQNKLFYSQLIVYIYTHTKHRCTDTYRYILFLLESCEYLLAASLLLLAHVNMCMHDTVPHRSGQLLFYSIYSSYT